MTASSAETASLTRPFVMGLVACSGDVVSVNVEDEICALPALLVHIGFGVTVVSARVVNVGGFEVADEAS